MLAPSTVSAPLGSSGTEVLLIAEKLERASLMALREYVPGSQLLVGGKLVTSHGLLKHWTGQKLDTYVGLRGRYSTCENGHFYYSISEEVAECPLCQAGPRARPLDLLFPKHGFSGAAWDPPRWSMDLERIGAAQTATMTFAQDLQNESIITHDDFAGVDLVAREWDGQVSPIGYGDEAATPYPAPR